MVCGFKFTIMIQELFYYTTAQFSNFERRVSVFLREINFATMHERKDFLREINEVDLILSMHV